MNLYCFSRLLVFIVLVSSIISCANSEPTQEDTSFTSAEVSMNRGEFEVTGRPPTESLHNIAIADFVTNTDDSPIWVREKIADLLYRSGKFAVLNSSLHPENPAAISEVNFSRWQTIGIDYLVTGNIEKIDVDRYSVEFELGDIQQERRLSQLSGDDIYCCRYEVDSEQLDRLGAIITDTIYEQVSGIEGYFNTKIMYTSVQDDELQTLYKLKIADVFLTTETTVLEIRAPVYSPALNPEGTSVAYISEEFTQQFALILHDLPNAIRKKLISSEEPIIDPDWSPDGKYIAFSMSTDGIFNVYTLEMESRELNMLTDSSSVDSEPSWIDEREILFTSDRSGVPQIYQMSIDNPGLVTRLTNDGAHNSSPSVSADKNGVVFVQKLDGNSRIAYQDITYGTVDILTTGAMVTSPKMSPNGEFVIFSAPERGAGEIGVTSIDGSYTYYLKRPNIRLQDPEW